MSLEIEIPVTRIRSRPLRLLAIIASSPLVLIGCIGAPLLGLAVNAVRSLLNVLRNLREAFIGARCAMRK